MSFPIDVGYILTPRQKQRKVTRVADLDRFFHPASVAVVGASDNPGSAGAMNFDQVRRWAQASGVRVHPVNPGRTEVDGLVCYPSILDIPEDIDVAIILVASAEDALEEAVRKKVAFAVVFTAGFAETGPQGAERQERLAALAAGGGVRLLGPNTTLNAFQTFRDDLPGKRIALITQSGHQGRPIYQAQDIGIGVAGWAPTGNEADLEAADFIRHFADQPDVGAIAAYIEGFKDGRSLQAALGHAAERGVPVVMIKVGRTEVGRSWAQSHSGHLAGSDAVIDALFRQYGVTRVDGLDELLDSAALLARSKPPTGDGVCIYSISGGTGAHTADLASAAGLRLAELSAGTQARLHEWIPEFLRVSNPVDSGGHATADERGPKILTALLADPDVSVLVVPIPGSFSPISEKFAQDLVAASAHTDKPVCVVWGSPVADEEAYRDILLPSGLPVFRSLGNCLGAVKAYLGYHAFRAHHGGVSTKRLIDRSDRHTTVGVGALSEVESKRLLTEYGIPVTRDILVTSEAEAAQAAEQVGYPVVLKACGATLAHKSDRGLVLVGLGSPQAVRDGFRALSERAPEADGVLVCELVTGGVETILGVSSDELLGPVVLFGIGGIAVEVYRDVTFRVPPFSPDEARRMLTELRGLALLEGWRGQPRADLDAIVDAIMKVQQLAVDLADDLVELDINPLLARADGVVALDALAVGC
jgi:acetate---CoA ligase (ADP-forming)